MIKSVVLIVGAAVLESKQLKIRLVAVVILLSIFGIVMQYSASSYNALKETGDAFFYVKKQSLSMVVALVFMFFATCIDTEKYIKLRWPILIGSLVLLAVIFIPALGIEKYGARRWLNLGFFTIQPSEISKFGLIIFLSAYLSQHPADKLKSLAICLVAIFSMCLLIMLEPNMSITMLVGMASMIMLIGGGMKFKHMMILAIPILIAVPILIFSEPYRIKRILAFLDPWANPRDEGFQLIQSYYALASGGLFGVGLFNSRQKYSFLPFAETDFIFSIIGEEFGFIGATLVLCIYAYIIYLGLKIALRARSSFESLLALGIVSIITIQTLLNIAVVTGSIPPTGLPLPFVSNGGSSLVVFFFAVGMLIKIADNSGKMRITELTLGKHLMPQSKSLYNITNKSHKNLINSDNNYTKLKQFIARKK